MYVCMYLKCMYLKIMFIYLNLHKQNFILKEVVYLHKNCCHRRSKSVSKRLASLVSRQTTNFTLDLDKQV